MIPVSQKVHFYRNRTALKNVTGYVIMGPTAPSVLPTCQVWTSHEDESDTMIQGQLISVTAEKNALVFELD
jgi:hypothetical protein